MSELAAGGIPVTVSCRVLKLASAPYYRWVAEPVGPAERLRRQRVDALAAAHVEEPEFGYRLLADEARDAGFPMADRTAWRLCSDAGIMAAIVKTRTRKGTKPGPPVFDDLVVRCFAADAQDRVWLTDITEHPTSEGKLYLCAIHDVFSRRIVGYSISDRMKAQLAVDAINHPKYLLLMGPDAGLLHIGSGNLGGFIWSSQHLTMMEVAGGATAGVGGQGASSGDAVAGAADAGASGGARVLASDRLWQEHRGRRWWCWGVGPRCISVVSSRWRYATFGPCRADRPVLVVRGA